jgi:hypothetical protein
MSPSTAVNVGRRARGPKRSRTGEGVELATSFQAVPSNVHVSWSGSPLLPVPPKSITLGFGAQEPSMQVCSAPHAAARSHRWPGPHVSTPPSEHLAVPGAHSPPSGVPGTAFAGAPTLERTSGRSSVLGEDSLLALLQLAQHAAATAMATDAAHEPVVAGGKHPPRAPHPTAPNRGQVLETTSLGTSLRTMCCVPYQRA